MALNTANSYATVDQYDAYMATLPIVAAKASTATVSQKEAALITATRLMQALPWVGIRATQEQPLAWPRSEAMDADGYDIPDTVIPWQVRDGCCEFAYRLLLSDRSAEGTGALVVSGMHLPGRDRQVVPPSAMDLFGCLLGGGGSSTIRIVR